MYVYFIQQGDDGPIKIGIARSPQERLAEFQTGNADELRLIGQRTVEGWNEAYEIEGGLHFRFANERVRGEWFKPSRRLLRTIAELADPPRELIQPDPAVPLTEDERWEAMAQRVRAAVSGSRP